jgi:hypothetical protein
VDFCGVGFGADEAHGGLWAEIDAGGLDCGEEGVGELAGIDAVLLEVEEVESGGVELREEVCDGCGCEEPGVCGVRGGDGLKGDAGLEWDGDS